jgi:FkbM family methyltransferase
MHRISDLLWERVHLVAGATGRNKNDAFVELFIAICEQINPKASFEVGAYGAEFSLELKRRVPRIAGFAFEANPYVFRQFKSQMPDGLAYLNQAIGSDTSPKQFHIPKIIPQAGVAVRLPENNRTSSLRIRELKGVEYETITCECSTLDTQHEEIGWPSSVLWIDVEGAIGDVIRGGVRAIERCVQCVMVELEKPSHWAGQWIADDVIKFMERMGFHPLARDFETSWQYNQIFVRQDAMTPRIVKLVDGYLDYIMPKPQTSAQVSPTAVGVAINQGRSS